MGQKPEEFAASRLSGLGPEFARRIRQLLCAEGDLKDHPGRNGEESDFLAGQRLQAFQKSLDLRRGCSAPAAAEQISPNPRNSAAILGMQTPGCLVWRFLNSYDFDISDFRNLRIFSATLDD